MTRALNLINAISYLVVVVAVGCIALSIAHPLPVRTEQVAASCTTGTHQQAGQCVALPSAPEVQDVATEEDVTAEGRDSLMVAYDASPDDLWNGLLEHTEWYDDEDSGGYGTFYVPTGTVVDVPGGLYLATVDGWAECRDDWFAAECSATGPTYLTHIPWHFGDTRDGCAVAAGLTFDAIGRGGVEQIEEDLSYAGMSPIEAACNDQLATAYFADGKDFPGEHDAAALLAFLDQRAAGVQDSSPQTA